jgi:hypothetical protein
MSSPEASLSAICPNDLGLKAAFWSQKDGEAVQFLRIVGWVSVTNYGQSDKEPFAPLVASMGGRLVFANSSTFPDYVGVFEKDATSAQIVDALKSAQKMGASRMPPRTMGGGSMGGGGGGGGPRPPTTSAARPMPSPTMAPGPIE